MITRLLLLSLATASQLAAEDWSHYYTIESVPVPPEVDPQIGGVTTLADGRIAACFNSGEVMLYSPAENSWSTFAQGLQCPLGIVEEEGGALVVMQWAELTRLRDTDGDGRADHYETVCDDFGISGNYHEFAYGPATGPDGNFYIALNAASNNAGIFKQVRGPWLETGLDREIMENWRDGEFWKKQKHKLGGMFSRVPYRGCILKITPGGECSTFAYGFRSPDGIGFDDQGRLWVTDNQGDWRGTSPLYHVTQDGFYGHPASLVWKPGWTRDPLDVPLGELESLRTRASGLFPHGELANSPTQPVPTVSADKFGIPKGDLLIGEMNQPTLVRFLPDEVGGFVQGTMVPFLFSTGLGIGNHRLAFAGDGALWIGKTHLKWAGDEGLKKITWKGNRMLVVSGVRLLPDGFEISFNHPLGGDDPELEISRHTYDYHSDYGSDKVDLKTVPVSGTRISNDRRSIIVTLPEIEAHYLYTIEIGGASDAESNPLMGNTLRYNVVNLAAKPGN